MLIRYCNTIVAGVLTLALTGLGSQAVAEKKPIVIGAAVALSGWMTHYDDGPYKGVQMAIEDINANGGVMGRKLKLVSADSKTDPAGSARAGSEVIEQGASLVITSCDFDFGGPAAFAADAKGVVAFATCAADPKFGVQGIGPHAFSMATATPGLAALSAEWAYKRAGWRSVYVLTDTIVEYTKSVCGHFKERWTELAGKQSIVGEDVFLGTDGAFPVQVSRLKGLAKRPDFVFLCTGGPGAAIVKQIRDAGVTTKLLATDSMDGSAWMQGVPNLSEFYFGAYGSMFGDDPNPEVRNFMARFVKKFGKLPVSSQAMTGYAVVQAFAKAVERAGGTGGKKLVAELEKFKGEKLLVGPTTFSKDLHINLDRGQLIMKVQNGKHSAVEWYAPEKVPAPKL